MDTNALRSLVEMGISEEVARDALNRTNGDVEAAGSLIFSNELSQCQSITENVGQSTHVELPAGPNNGFKPGDLNDIVANAQQTDSEDCEDIDLDMGEEYLEDKPSYEESCHKLQISDPTVVLPLPPNFLLENYFALFSLFVVNYIPHILATPDFQDLNYDKDWYRGNALQPPTCRVRFVAKNEGEDDEVEIVPFEQLTEDDKKYTLQPELLWQLQKLASVVNSRISDRAYVRAKVFAIALEPQVQRNLADAEHLYEILPSFIKSLAIDLEMCPNFHDDDVRHLFISSAFHTPSTAEPHQEQTMRTRLSLFHFLPEEYDSNLYRMFNVLLYPDANVDGDLSDSPNSDNESENSLSDLAPILTIVFDEMEETTETVVLAEGVEIPLEFYPQLYTKNCKDKLINHIISKRRESQLESRAILKELNSLKAFQGKDLLKFINSSLDYLQKDGKSQDVIDSLLKVKDQITDRKTAKMNEYKQLAQRLHGEWNLSHPDIQIVKTAKTLGLIDEPYILSMAAISPYLYYIRNRDGQWHFVRSSPLEPTFHVRACSSPLEVQDAIKQFTRQPSEAPLMFVYCKQSFIPDDETVWKTLEKNKGCSKFAKDDQLHLNRSNTRASSPTPAPDDL